MSRLLEGIEGLESLEFCMLLARTGSEIANIGGNPGGNVEVSEEQGQAVLHQMRMHNTEIRKDFAGLQSRLDAAEKVLEQHVDDGRSAADALQEAKDALASRSIEVDFLEQDLAHASEQISALSDQVWLQVDAAEMHRQLDSTNSRVGELEAWLASREEGLHQAEIRSAQMAQLNDRLSERVQELEMMGMGDGQNSARAPQTSAWLEQRDDTIERLHMDVEKLRKTIVAKEMDAKSAQARADACKQAMEKARQLWKGSEDQLRRELRASMKEAMQAKELCHNAKVEVENLRKRQEAASSLGGVDEGEPGVFQKHCSVHSTAQQAPHRPSDRVRGEDVTQLAALERKICLMGEQRKLEQEAVMMHMESSEEEVRSFPVLCLGNQPRDVLRG